MLHIRDICGDVDESLSGTNLFVKKGLLASLIMLPMFVGACGADPTNPTGSGGSQQKSNKITGSVSEWHIDLSATHAASGNVMFGIANFGSMPHEFLVVKTSYGPGEIPVGSNNRINEEGGGVNVVDEISEWPANEVKILSVNLDAGSYELLCNLPGHYANGMHHTFIVG